MIAFNRGQLQDTAASFGFPGVHLVEKDVAVVNALQALGRANLGGARLIFAGGTCLARAHCLIKRMSEDIDLKVVLPDMDQKSKNAIRKELSRVKHAAREALQQAGFDIGDDCVSSRNDNRNIDFRFAYGERPEDHSVLDPMIKIELVCKETRLATTNRPVRTLVSEAFGNEPEIPQIECVSIEETAAEKIVSLTRRVAALLENARPDVPFDHRLVRHIYDLNAMVPHLDMKKVGRLAREISISDAAEFRNQNPEYAADPVGWTAKAVEDMEENTMHRHDYDSFVREMVYGEMTDFDTAMGTVRGMTRGLWPSQGVHVPSFPVATHALKPADGAVHIIKRADGKVDNPGGPAIVTVDGKEKWFREGMVVEPFAARLEDDEKPNAPSPASP